MRKCSVIVPTYNRSQLLRHTLRSLACQNLPTDQFEVLVIDDGSSDSTAAVADAFRTTLDLRYFFQEDEGFRVAAARNVGISNATGGICVFIDSGVLLHAGCLRAHRDAHAASPAPLALCGYVYGFSHDATEVETIVDFVDVADPTGSIEAMAAADRWPDVRERFYARHGDDFGSVPAPWFVYWTCNASARTEQLRAVGMFDEQFRRWGGEDIDLGFRLHRAGARFKVDRHACALHYPHEKSHRALAEGAQENYRYIAQKYGTPETRVLTLSPPVDFVAANDMLLEHTADRRSIDSDSPS